MAFTSTLASSSMQSALFNSTPHVSHGNKASSLKTFLPRQHQQQECTHDASTYNAWPSRKEQDQSNTPTPKVNNTDLFDVLSFTGPAPERINGRLAMLGFVAAIAVELARGDDVFAQLANGGLPLFVGSTVVLSLASLIPLLKGVTVESKSQGIMTSDAEMVNGRIAMLGLVALVFIEFVKGRALV